MATKTGELRESLMDAIERVKAGKMVPEDAQAIAKLAGQITASLTAESNIRANELRKGELGSMPIGEV